MTMHLSKQEFVNALDRTLAAARQAHLSSCASCQAQVAQLRAMVEEAGHAAAVPEPSPLFWDHMQSRVLAAVEAEGVRPSSDAWWRAWARPKALLTASATALAVVTGMAVYISRPVAPSFDRFTQDAALVESSELETASLALAGDEWEFVARVMGTLEGDDIHEVLTPSHDAVDAAFEALTSDERERFVKLLKAELAEGTE